MIAKKDGTGFSSVYDHKVLENSQLATEVNMLVQEDFLRDNLVTLQDAPLSSDRFISDLSFSKDATFYHNLFNSRNEPIEVLTQEYFVESLKPYMHELKVFLRDLDNHQNQYQLHPN